MLKSVSSEDVKVALEASERFELDQVEALVLVLSQRVQIKGSNWRDPEENEEDAAWWDELLLFYSQERFAIIEFLSLVLKFCKHGFLSLTYTR